jgi:hypothetical protein
MKFVPLTALLCLFPICVFSTTLVAAATPSGQLTFSLKTAGVPLIAPASFYDSLVNSSQGPIFDGAAALSEAGKLGDNPASGTIDEAVSRIINPEGKFESFYNMIAAKENAWSLPIVQYALGDESDDEQIYVTINRDLRDPKPDSASTEKWVTGMRQAMWRLPRFEGISFRGTRLSPARVKKYYQLSQSIVDPGFLSTSLNLSTALKFADPEVNGDDEATKKEKLAVIFIVHGKTGRPVSKFAHMHDHETEILFANGSPFTVTGISPEFVDKQLGKSIVIVLVEK